MEGAAPQSRTGPESWAWPAGCYTLVTRAGPTRSRKRCASGWQIVTMKSQVAVVSLVFALVLVVVAACGGDDGDEASQTQTPTLQAQRAPGDGPATFDISQLEDSRDGVVSTGSQRFEPPAFIVSAGQQVTFNITNRGESWHNMRVDGGDGALGTADDTLSDHEPRFLPGDTGTLVWTAPNSPGEIQFRCDFHPDVMIGSISVE